MAFMAALDTKVALIASSANAAAGPSASSISLAPGAPSLSCISSSAAPLTSVGPTYIDTTTEFMRIVHEEMVVRQLIHLVPNYPTCSCYLANN